MNYQSVPDLRKKIAGLEHSKPTVVGFIELGNAYKRLEELVSKGYAVDYGIESPERPEQRAKMLRAYMDAMDIDPSVILDVQRGSSEGSHFIISSEGLTNEEKQALLDYRQGGKRNDTPLPAKVAAPSEEAYEHD
jgi:hypothetical protein